MDKNKHMDLEARTTIERELGKGSSFKSIARLLGKDNTTISKEVRRHLSYERTGACGRSFNDCAVAFRHECSRKNVCKTCNARFSRVCWSCGKCRAVCPSYEKYQCPKLAKPPYVCNSCGNRSKCSLEKAFYYAFSAQKTYEKNRSESRSGFGISEDELRQIDQVISPLLINGQSIHHIALTHQDEIMKSERTLYTYVNNGLISARNIDMPRTVRMRPRKGKPKALKVDKACRIGRTYEDYLAFLEENPDTPIRQLDSVEGIKGSSVLLTIYFVGSGLQLACLRPSNNSQSVIDVFNCLYRDLGPEAYRKLFPLLLADNGSEFSNPKAIEYDSEGKLRSRMFYCNANAPYEKGNCENNHEMIRRCIPKGVDIGKYTQEQISLMMSHINSYARPNLGDKSPYDVFAFQYGESILKIFGLKRIPADEIILTKDVFK